MPQNVALLLTSRPPQPNRHLSWNDWPRRDRRSMQLTKERSERRKRSIGRHLRILNRGESSYSGKTFKTSQLNRIQQIKSIGERMRIGR